DPTLGRMISNAVTVAKGTAAWPPSRELRRSSSGGLRSAARAEARRSKWREQAEEGLWSMYQEEVLKQRHGALRKGRSWETRAGVNRSGSSILSDGGRPSTGGMARPRRVSLKPPLETFRSRT
ncbi:hypothetical protein FOZ63_003005, partial [Perkinsus olseni]